MTAIDLDAIRARWASRIAWAESRPHEIFPLPSPSATPLDVRDLIAEVEKLREVIGEQRHIVDIVDIEETDFGLQHPIECRDDLLGCAVGVALHALDGPPMPVGRYVVVLDDDGLHFSDLDAT